MSGFLNEFLHQIVNSLPGIIGALLILLVGYIVSKVVAGIIKKALDAAKLNSHLHAGKGGNLIQRAFPDPAGVISKIAFWLLFLFTVSMAVSTLGIPALVNIVNEIYAYLPNVIAALAIFLVAGAVSGVIATLVTNAMGDTPTGKVVATAAPLVVMGLAVFMILNQLKIAPEIVTITYAGIVATATLAFGLGGRDAASKMFMGLYEAGQENKSAVASDFNRGAANAKDKAHELKNRAQRAQ